MNKVYQINVLLRDPVQAGGPDTPAELWLEVSGSNLRVMVFSEETANACSKYLRKGSKVLVEGALACDTDFYISAQRVEFLGS